MSVRLYVKLPKAELEKEKVEKMFGDFESSFTTKLIKERKNRECRGFGFVTVPDDAAAETFINMYNEKPFIYEGETFKDEEGQEFTLLIEKALPRQKSNKNEGDEENSESSSEVTKPKIQTNNSNSPRPKKGKKNRKGDGKTHTGKPVSVAESIQPDPRWASELSKLKEMFAAQTTN